MRNQHLVMRASMSQAARWGWVSTNVVALATLGRRTTQPRSAMTADDVRAVIEAGERFDPAAGLAFRLAAITGARRSELCALVCSDVNGDRLTIDSSIAIEREGSINDKRRPALDRRSDEDGEPADGAARPERTMAAIEALRVEREKWGPWMLQPGGAAAEPRADDQVVEPRSPRRRYRVALALARPAPLVGDRGDRPRPRHPHRRRPIGARQPSDDAAHLRPRHRRRRCRRCRHPGRIFGR